MIDHGDDHGRHLMIDHGDENGWRLLIDHGRRLMMAFVPVTDAARRTRLDPALPRRTKGRRGGSRVGGSFGNSGTM
jgi:hypothetical protein